MKPCCNPVVIVLLVFLLSISLIPCCASPVRDGDPGTIGECLSKADGTEVTLTCEQVMWRGKSGKSFAVKEWFEKWPERPRLLVVSSQSLSVESYWSVDVSGTISTLRETTPDGTQIAQRVLVVSPSDVQIYCSRDGKPVPCAIFKGFASTACTKRSITELGGSAVPSTMSTVMSGELPPPPDAPDPPLPSPGSRDSLKWLPDGSRVSINGAIVSADFTNLGLGFFYVESSDRSFGIWISSQEYVYEGQLVDITGTMATGGGERAVVADQGGITALGYYYPRPIEIGLSNRTLGGGAVGSFTPAVADAAGLNTTGLLVRVWGKVTAVDDQNRAFYIDDGSNVAADAEHVGVKVYDYSYDSLPTVDPNNIISISGVSCAEYDDASDTSIRVVYKTTSVARSTQPGSGTISGTITATGANGKTVRLYCGSTSTTATFSGDTANYTMNVPYGDHAVTASVIGYKTSTQLATVSSGTPVDLDFNLSTIQNQIDIVLPNQRITPDGMSETTITAIVRDEEGRRLANEPVIWTVNPAYVVSQDTATNVVGEAHLVLQAPSTPSTEAVYIIAAGTTSRCFIEFAEPDTPSIWITNPNSGDTVSGDVRISLYFNDPDGTYIGVSRISILVDGVEYSSWPATIATTTWYSFKAPNGNHQLRAVATDYDGNVAYSNSVTVVSENEISALQILPEQTGPNQPVTIQADVGTPAQWTVNVLDVNGVVKWSTTGTGSTVSTRWIGTPDAGVYTVSVERTGSASSFTGPIIVNTTDSPDVLLVAEQSDFYKWDRTLGRLQDIVQRKGLTCVALGPLQATWENISSLLSQPNCRYFYFQGHGQWIAWRPEIPDLPIKFVTHLQLTASRHMLYAYQWDNQLVEGDPDPYNPGYRIAYATSLQRTALYPVKFAYINSCYSGHIGAYRNENETDYYSGK